jgi:hypothetical protein
MRKRQKIQKLLRQKINQTPFSTAQAVLFYMEKRQEINFPALPLFRNAAFVELVS